MRTVRRRARARYRRLLPRLHGFDHSEPSWTWARWPDSGYRLDHVLASVEITARSCDYRHELRLGQLSDHWALEADLELPAPPA